MISICGSIYKSPNNIVKFIENTVQRASHPKEIEIICVHDESDKDNETAKSLEELKIKYPQLTVIPVTKTDRLEYVLSLIKFYDINRIFPPEEIKDFIDRHHDYAEGILSSLWIPPGRNHNLAVEKSKGDVIIISPFDVLYEFDVNEVYHQVKQKYQDNDFCIYFSSKESFGVIPNNHGMRIFNRGLYEKVKQTDSNYSPQSFSFDERWFLRPLYEDVWNDKVGLWVEGRRSWRDIFNEDKFITPFINDNRDTQYLSSRNLANMDNNNYYMEYIKAYWHITGKHYV